MVFPMGLQWIEMRIAEEKERRAREELVRASLPRALEEVGSALCECLAAYREAFGEESAEISSSRETVRVIIREERHGAWNERGTVTITLDYDLPGFRVENGAEPQSVKVGLLAEGRMFYKYADRYLSIEELTKQALDRSLFPDLDHH